MQFWKQALLREIIRSATGAVEDCYGFTGGIDEFVDQIETKIFSVTQNRVSESACKGMGWLMGLEPTTTGITIRDSTN